MDRHIKPNEEKFVELLLYIAKRSQGDSTFGSIKLNKILFYAEFEAYRELGQPISGVPFQNLEYGPAPRRLLPIQKQLLEFGEARMEYEPTPAGVQKRLIPLREPDLSAFSPEEIDIIDRVINRLHGLSAAKISEEAHETAGWIVTSEGETIPYHMALLGRPVPTLADQEYVQELIKRGAVEARL